jgi:uncharacterized protein (TIGR04255 family)
LASPHENIVNFKHPPVAEVALAVQFAEPVTDDTTTLSKFWPAIQADFPEVKPQPPLPPLTETFEVPAPPSISFQLLGGPQDSRYWFLGTGENELVQVQPDRFGFNWRKGPADDVTYPRYPYVRSRFESVFSSFVDALRQVDRAVHPTWCEVTYINPVAFGSPGEPRPDLSTVLRRLVPYESQLLPKPDSTTYTDRFLLVRDGAPFGRFYLTVNPAYTDDRSLGYNLILRMIGQPQSPDLAGVLGVFDEGRHLIVNTFRDITTPQRHDEWGRDDNG